MVTTAILRFNQIAAPDK